MKELSNTEVKKKFKKALLIKKRVILLIPEFLDHIAMYSSKKDNKLPSEMRN